MGKVLKQGAVALGLNLNILASLDGQPVRGAGAFAHIYIIACQV